MAIRQKGSKFQVDVTVKGVRAPRVSCDTHAEARKVEAEFKAKLLAGVVPEQLTKSDKIGKSPKCSLVGLVDATYSEFWQGTKGETTALTNANSWCEELGEDFPITALGAAEVSEVCDRWVAKGLKPSTINRKIAALSMMLKVAEARGIIDKRIALTRKKEYEGRLRYFSDAEVESLINHAKVHSDPLMAPLFILAVETGMRQGELLALTARDVSLKNRMITLYRTKGNKSRSVPLTSRAFDTAQELAGKLRAHERLFPEALTRRRVFEAVSRWRRHEGLPKDDEACFHTFRHTTCSRLVQAGVPILVVQRWMGHSSINTTMRYAHLAPDSLNVALAALNEWTRKDERKAA